MGTILWRAALLLTLVPRLSLGQNCPILGPAYPAVANVSSSPVLNAAKATFTQALTEALSNGQLDGEAASFAVQVFSTFSDRPIFEYYHTASGLNGSLSGSLVGPDTLYRIGSISKLVTVYAALARLPHKHWGDPITDFVHELADARVNNAVENVDWSEVTLEDLASQMSGIARDCKSQINQSTVPRLTFLDTLNRCPRRPVSRRPSSTSRASRFGPVRNCPMWHRFSEAMHKDWSVAAKDVIV